MAIDPIQVLQAAQRPMLRTPTHGARPETTLLIAGATGALGNELLRRLAGSHRYAQARVLAREPMQDGLRGVQTVLMPQAADPRAWPRVQADVALVSFDPPRLYHDRERALWTPVPEELPQVAAWLHGCGVRTLAVVQPHAQGRLPEALKRGLASMDEQSVAALGFERLILVRSAQKPAQGVRGSAPQRVAEWMLSIARFMVPASEQPVRAAVVAHFVDAALRLAPPGTHVAAPERVWRAAQGDTEAAVREWLQGAA